MAQTELANQGIFRYIRERGQDPNLDCRQCLCPDGHRQEGIADSAFSGRNPANCLHLPFRESLFITSTYGKYYAKPKNSKA